MKFSFRTVLFWIHLAAGLTAGLVVFSMSITGVLLTYERQILNWSAQSDYVPDALQINRRSLDELFIIAKQHDNDFSPRSVGINNNPGAPVTFSAGRSSSLNLNAYTGTEMEIGSSSLDGFFRTVTGVHRWFNVQGENRTAARWVTGVSNIIFLFLLLSGLYLWLPKIWRWRQFRSRLTFLKNVPSSKARDFNWHHVFGIWTAIPLIVIVFTGSVFFFSWPTAVLNTVFGAELVERGRADAGSFSVTEKQVTTEYSLDEIYQSALANTREDWKTISISLPSSGDELVEVNVDWGNGAQSHKRETLILNLESRALENVRGFSDSPKAQKIRGIVRFLHTGEIFGVAGQTIAGLVSFVALIMVWTGFALSYRRLIKPILKK